MSFGYQVLGFGSFASRGGPVTLENEGSINSQANIKLVTASDYIGAGGLLIIPADFWVWSDATGTAALIVDVADCTIENNGKIIGQGGGGNGVDGGNAISITASGVTITSASGAYIAGGGGSGGRGYQSTTGGGGAGGGAGGGSAAGGVLNAVGDNGGTATGANQRIWGYGGGAGGGGGGHDSFGTGVSPHSGAGGRILPGDGGLSGNDVRGTYRPGYGGSAGNAGGNHNGAVYSGGGGGWGANGGLGGNGSSSNVYSGGTGGKAIEDNGNSYTLSNSGTIYGATT